MVKKVQAQMSTEVALDMLKASESIKSITTRVNSFTQSWKASEAQMKSAGDYVGAATAKYEGLGKSITAQKDKIAKLKKEQSELKGNTQETAQEYLKYQNQIDKATTKLSSLEAQQNRAKQSMEYQKSGLAGLQHSLELNNKAIQSHVERLRAEGKETEANEAQKKGLSTTLEKQTKLYEAQRQELKRLTDSGEASADSISKQKIALEKTGKSLAENKQAISALNSEMDKTSPNPFVRLKSSIKSTNEQAEKTHSIFKSVFSASLLSNAVTGAWNIMTLHIGDAVRMGNTYLEQQDKMNAQWKTLAGSDSGAKAMVKGINDLATSAQNSSEMVNGLASQFYAIDKNKDHVLALSKATLTLQDAFGASDDAVQNFGQQWSQMMANGKVSAQDFMSFTNVFPALKPALLDYEKDVTHNSNLTMKQLNDMISQGKISSETMNTVLENTAKKNKEATKNFGETIPGMTRTITATMPKLIGELEKPFYKMKNPLVGSISKWVTDKDTAKEFNALGKATTKALSNITEAFGGTKLNGGKVLDGVIKGLTKSVQEFGKWTATHKKDIKEFFGNFKEKSADTIKVLGASLQAFSAVTMPLIKLMAQHPKVAGTFLAGFMIANKLTAPIAMMGAMGKATKGMYNSFKDSEGIAHKGLSKLSGAVKATDRGIKRGLKFTASVATKGAKLAMAGLVKTAKVTGRGIKLAFNFLKANPFILIITGITAVVAGFVALYKHNKKFRNFVNGIAKDAKKYIGKAVDAVKSLGKWVGNIGSGAKKGWNNFTKSTSNGAKSAVKHFSNFKRDAGKHLSNLWKSGKSTFSNGWKTVTNASKSGAHNVGNWFSNMSNDTRKKAIQMFNHHKATFQSGYKVLNNLTNTWHDFQTGRWGKLGSDLRNTANSIRSFVHNIFADMYNWLNKLTGGQLGKMVDFWKSKMGSIGDIVASAKASVHKHFVDLVRGVISPFNTLLSGIHKGISWILSKIGSGKLSGEWKIPVPSYATGTKDTHQGGLAQVNDGTGSNYREIYRLPNGQMGMFPAVHNMILPLPKGTSILNGDLSAKYAKLLGIPMYKSGVGDFFSGLWNGAKDVIEDTDKIIKAPEEFMKSVLKHFIGNTSSKISLAQDLITGLPNMVAKNAVKWIKKMFASISNPSGSGVERWRSVIKAVAGQMNFNISEGQVAKLLRQINTESGGNPTVKQGISDINSREGHPAQGLLQFIPSTFNHWALKGRNHILNGSDQIAAAINALNHGGEGGWGNIGNGHGWANGGIVSNWQYAQIAEHNKPEAVIPLDSAKDSRAWQVLKQVVDIKTAGTSSTATATTSDASNQIAELTNTVKAMANMLNTIIGLNADQVTATKGIGTFDQNKFYKKMATDQGLSDYQSF